MHTRQSGHCATPQERRASSQSSLALHEKSPCATAGGQAGTSWPGYADLSSVRAALRASVCCGVAQRWPKRDGRERAPDDDSTPVLRQLGKKAGGERAAWLEPATRSTRPVAVRWPGSAAEPRRCSATACLSHSVLQQQCSSLRVEQRGPRVRADGQIF